MVCISNTEGTKENDLQLLNKVLIKNIHMDRVKNHLTFLLGFLAIFGPDNPKRYPSASNANVLSILFIIRLISSFMFIVIENFPCVINSTRRHMNSELTSCLHCQKDFT